MAGELVSIDIGSKVTKVMEAVHRQGVLDILSIHSFDTPFKENNIDAKEFFAQLYSRIPRDKVKYASVAIAIPPSAINFAVLKVPKMPREDLDKVIMREAARRILPTPASGDIFDYSILKETKTKEASELDILVGAGSKDIINGYLELFKKEEITPTFIVSTPNALIRYLWEYKPSIEQNWALIDIGFRNTSIVVLNKSDIVLIRNIPFASFDFIQAIAKKSALNFVKAEEVFLREQFISDDPVLSSWKYLLSEIRRSFAYYKEITGGAGIDSILFSGGIFRLSKSVEFISKNMGGNLEFFKLSSSKNVNLKISAEHGLAYGGPDFATAMGVILDFKLTQKATLNFVSADIRLQQKMHTIKFFSAQVLLIVAAVMVFFTISFRFRVNVLKGRLAAAEKNFSESEYVKLTQKADFINARLGNIRKEKQVMDGVSKSQVPWEGLFAVLNNSIPEDLFIKKLTVTEDQGQKKKAIKITINGAVFGDYEFAKSQIDSFYNKLLDSKFFAEVYFEPIKLEEVSVGEEKSPAVFTAKREREFNIQLSIKNIKDETADIQNIP